MANATGTSTAQCSGKSFCAGTRAGITEHPGDTHEPQRDHHHHQCDARADDEAELEARVHLPPAASGCSPRPDRRLNCAHLAHSYAVVPSSPRRTGSDGHRRFRLCPNPSRARPPNWQHPWRCATKAGTRSRSQSRRLRRDSRRDGGAESARRPHARDPPPCLRPAAGDGHLPRRGCMKARLFAAENRKWWTLAAVAVGLFMIMLDNTVVIVALPSIQQDLGMSPSELEWVVNAYALTFGVLLLSGGKLADLLGRRAIFIVGLVIFTAPSLWCGLAAGAASLIPAGAVQGIAAALMSPGTRSLMSAPHP